MIIGHLAPYVVEKSMIDVVIILRKNPYKLEQIYEERKYSKEKIKENLGSEIIGITAHDAISEFGSEKTFQVDTTNQIMKENQERAYIFILKI